MILFALKPRSLSKTREKRPPKFFITFREIDRRRLYSKHKCASLNEYIIKFHGYTEQEAWIRVSAMRLLKELPEIETKINAGALNLSTLSLAQRAFRKSQFAQPSSEQLQMRVQAETLTQESPLLRSEVGQGEQKEQTATPIALKFATKEAKLELISKLENRTKREAIKILHQETGIKVTSHESVRELSDDKVELKLVVTKEEFELIKRLKGLCPGSDYSSLYAKLAKEKLQKADPLEKAKRAVTRGRASSAQSAARRDVGRIAVCPDKPKSGASLSVRSYIPAPVRHAVWMKSNGRCVSCGSQSAPQIDHIKPVALGGTNDVENLQLLCRSCNQRRAIVSYGADWMEKYLT